MAKCPFCDHSNRTDVTQCEKCGGPLQATFSGESDQAPPAAVTEPEPGSIEAEVLGLMRRRKKIEAIKVYRQRTGIGLKEAKDFVEALAAKHGVPVGSGGGCAGALLLMFVVGGGAAGAAWLLAMS
jgi:hypothetical protein